MNHAAPSSDTLTLQIPFRIIRRGGRKEIVLPAGAVEPRRTDSTLVRALGRAFRWKRLLDTGACLTMAEIAEGEGLAMSYVSRLLQLTLLAPDIVEAILDENAPYITGESALTAMRAVFGAIESSEKGCTVKVNC